MDIISKFFNMLGKNACLARALFTNGVHFIALCARSRTALAAENLFLRKQLAFYQERKVAPRSFDNVSRFILVLLSRVFAWKGALVNVTPKTFIGWHRQGFRLFWRWKSRPGRPPIPPELRALIREMARDNIGWGEERIANELLFKLGIRISPRTIRKYMPKRPKGQPRGDQRWSTFVANHAKAIVACDFLTVVTAKFKFLYVFVIIEIETRKLIHTNVTDHPTAAWTQQRLREAIPSDHTYRFLIHDRDCIFSADLDKSIRNLGLRVLKSPYRSPHRTQLLLRAGHWDPKARVPGLSDPIEQIALTSYREKMGWLLQPVTPAYVAGSWYPESTRIPSSSTPIDASSNRCKPEGEFTPCAECTA